jgi:hypothetical protein
MDSPNGSMKEQGMGVTRERFESGMTYDEYKAQMTRNRDRFDAAESGLTIDPADLAAFQAVPRPLNVLVLAEDWCGDVIANVPIIGRLAKESGKLNVRVFLRDQNLDIMDQYLNRGEFRSIPVFVFFDDDFNEIGRFIERPASVTDLRATKRQEIFAAHPEFGSPTAPMDQLPEETRQALQAAMAEMREQTAPIANATVIREIRAIVDGAASRR